MARKHNVLVLSEDLSAEHVLRFLEVLMRQLGFTKDAKPSELFSYVCAGGIPALLAICLGRLDMNLVRCADVITTLKATMDCSGRIQLPVIHPSPSSGFSETLNGNEKFLRGEDFGTAQHIEAMIVNTPIGDNPPEIRTSYLHNHGYGDCSTIQDVLEWAISSWKDIARVEVKEEHPHNFLGNQSRSFIPLSNIRSVIAKTVSKKESIPSNRDEMQRLSHTILTELGMFFSRHKISDVTYIILKSEQRSEVHEASDLRAIYEAFGRYSGNNGSEGNDLKRQKTRGSKYFVFTAKSTGFDVSSILAAAEELKDENNERSGQ